MTIYELTHGELPRVSLMEHLDQYDTNPLESDECLRPALTFYAAPVRTP